MTDRDQRLTKDLFAGSAEYYARFRLPYPDELLDHVAASAAPGEPARLLDLGSGTGELAIPLSARFDEVDAVDVSEEMVELGRRKAGSSAASSRIRWVVTAAEDYTAPPGHFSLVTAGSAFHWMDRRTLAGRIRTWLRPGGTFAIVGANSTWNGDEPWQHAVIGVVRRWLGDERRAGSGVFTQPKERESDLLAAAGFTDLDERTFPVRHTWTLDEFMGYLYSTSFASRQVLADRAEGFERDLRATLLGYAPDGALTETVRFRSQLGRTPGATADLGGC